MQRTRKRNSCSECYLRKQKCDRRYPCCHCTRRRRPEICNFATNSDAKPIEADDATDTGNSHAQESDNKRSRGDFDSSNDDDSAETTLGWHEGRPPRKRDCSSSESSSTTVESSHSSDLVPKLSSEEDDDCIPSCLGYSEDSTENLAGLMKRFGLLERKDKSGQLAETAYRRIGTNYHKIMEQNLPRRLTIDTLIQNFFREANWMYEAIHPPTFLTQYENWWKTSPGTTMESVSFAILLLRICAYTTQFLPSTSYTAATIGGEALSTIRNKCHNLATTLTSLHKSSGASPTRIEVSQFFFAACHAKNEGRVKESWDFLGEAIQLALDLGMHQEKSPSDVTPPTEFELVMRRRTFWNLYIWDSFMSVVLDRWPRIPLCTLSYSETQVSLGPVAADVPDAFIERILQVRIARLCSSDHRPSCGQPPRYDMHNIEAQHESLRSGFIPKLPPIFALDQDGIDWDNLALNWKRRVKILHLTIHAVISNLHRPVLQLFRSDVQALSDDERKLTYQHRLHLVDSTLALLDSISQLHVLLGSGQTQLFILSFFTFEAAMQLGMHLLNIDSIEDLYTSYYNSSASSSPTPGACDTPNDPWKKARCLQEMSMALERLRLLGEVSAIARVGDFELNELIARVKQHHSLIVSTQSVSGINLELANGSTNDLPAESAQSPLQAPPQMSQATWSVDPSTDSEGSALGEAFNGVVNDTTYQAKPPSNHSFESHIPQNPSNFLPWTTTSAPEETSWQPPPHVSMGFSDFMPNAAPLIVDDNGFGDFLALGTIDPAFFHSLYNENGRGPDNSITFDGTINSDLANDFYMHEDHFLQ